MSIDAPTTTFTWDNHHLLQVHLPPACTSVVSVSAGYAHTVIKDEAGNTYVFGQNTNGQLGIGSDTTGEKVQFRAAPVKVTNVSDATGDR